MDIAHELEPFRLTLLNNIEKPNTRNGIQEVDGSIPFSSTNKISRLCLFLMVLCR